MTFLPSPTCWKLANHFQKDAETIKFMANMKAVGNVTSTLTGY